LAVPLFKSMENTKTHEFESYVESFKSKMVKRYNWSIKQCNEFDNSQLYQHFLNGDSILDAYYKIFNVAPDLCEN
jgi:hypothetical protein